MYPSSLHRAIVVPVLGLGLMLPAAIALAQASQQSFADVPSNHPAYQAVEYLKVQGIISGYSDGAFRPDKNVNRAEAVKIIVAPLIAAGELPKLTAATYGDVPIEAWFAPYIEIARAKLGIVDGPPKTTVFYGERPVKKAEFLKMLLLAHKVDPGAFGEIRLPLALDVTNPDEWYYPYMRYAITASVTMVSSDGLLAPGRELTRADVAIFLHRLLMYREGRRTQALLTESETEIANILDFIGKNDVQNAELASARALLSARGAHARQPTIPLVQAALKITESFRTLVRAYRAGVSRQFDDAIALAGEAWNLAAKGGALHSELANIAEKVQQIAKTMADNARSLKAQVSK
ncbi:hypothetical protein A3H22_03625 [Candidatus Peribacteria bacterium RIFCSPLOWO2_12_FULL_55_15]|nr:MAG: hypothetical protein A2789_01185 [Candidatus Peribacteria bacterium RIFCSPHIGHO2_01_FULL_54_22]OGJ63727.1 MAG: hypothetical protein A3D12_03195 [Candidatus Peribacteria bacterium RIFCSPHIGHO2_02_FULL_55_24]OGJ64581.1 MAG: hypothetical protein A3E47_01150 [Candidatus Peribacteria bacterium RIFCSPHIGHO2_12_FULL_54_10]OGJ68083.1 MAG: hypothetical protein A2947_02690 [Candidatus Peribacteria bacterium RIFCSPLOWO2_01_FULL_54_110]OGJ68943.1 MAG: hypothetical protein A3H90_04020 [Candidatus Pe